MHCRAGSRSVNTNPPSTPGRLIVRLSGSTCLAPGQRTQRSPFNRTGHTGTAAAAPVVRQLNVSGRSGCSGFAAGGVLEVVDDEVSQAEMSRRAEVAVAGSATDVELAVALGHRRPPEWQHPREHAVAEVQARYLGEDPLRS